jgi:acetyl esterase/lipase
MTRFPVRALAAACFVSYVMLEAATSGLAKPANPLDRFEPVPASEPIPVVDFFRPPLLYSPQINEAGTHFAAYFTDPSDRVGILVYDLPTGKFETLIGTGDSDLYEFHWLGDSHLLYKAAKGKTYAGGTSVAEVGRLHSAYRIDLGVHLDFLVAPRKEPLKPLVWLRTWERNGSEAGVLKINARRALRPDMEFRDLFDTKRFPYGTAADVIHAYPVPKAGVPVGYFCDKDENLAFAYTIKDGIYTLHRLEEGQWKPCAIDLDHVDVLGAGDRAGEVIVAGPRVAGKPWPVRRMDAATGEPGEILYQDTRYDANRAYLHRHPVTRSVIGLQFSRTTTHSVWFTDEHNALQKRLQASLPVKNAIVQILGSDRAEKRFVVMAFSDRIPPAYYQIDLEKGQIGLIKSSAPWIDPERMRPMQTMTYKTRDGFRLEGYVTLPADASKEKPVPLVVMPHGGPWERDHWGWSPEVQFLASRGYAVFQPNYRGSTDAQWQFSLAETWEFRRMHDDVTDGVKALLKTGVIDAERVAIVGGSFGGYLALCGVTFEPGLYRSAVTIAGVFDWERMLRDMKNHDGLSARYERMLRILGDPKRQQERFEEMSPLRHIEQVKVPLFVIHGKEDSTVGIDQSKRLVSLLGKHGIPHEKRYVSREGHGFLFYQNRVEIFEAVETFLAKTLAPQASSIPAAASR